MTQTELTAFAMGLLAALGTWAIVKILIGIKLNLYLVSCDSGIPDQNLIPLTSSLKKKSWWKILINKLWVEDLVITLMDNKGRSFHYQIKYHIWGGFYLSMPEPFTETTIDGKPIIANKRYYLKTGMKLHPGDRKFSILVTSESIEKVARYTMKKEDRPTVEYDI